MRGLTATDEFKLFSLSTTNEDWRDNGIKQEHGNWAS